MTEPIAQIAQIISCTEAEGPGKRFAIWFQGCPLRCLGCCNPEFLPFEGGEPIPLAEIITAITHAQQEQQIEGITLLGGEPFAHTENSALLAEAAHQLNLSVMIFSGYILEELRAKADPWIDQVLLHTDILVDGPYMRELPDNQRRWIGSTNQRIHFLSPRYQADDPCWQKKNTLEIRVVGSEIIVNGFPALGAKDFWKGKFRKVSPK